MKKNFLFFIAGLFCTPHFYNGMLVKWNLGSDFSGKMNGMVAGKGLGGTWLRNQRKGVNPRSETQQEVKAKLSVTSKSWAALTDADRLAWTYAAKNYMYSNRVGDMRTLSGIAFYNKCLMNCWKIGQAIPTTPPPVLPIPAIESITSITATAGASTISMVFTPTPTDAAVSHVVYATRPMSAGRMSYAQSYRQIAVIAAAATSPAALGAAYTSVFGAFVAGERISFKIVPVLDDYGVQGVPIEFSTLAV